ncbi:MAG: 50S ribosomal protein L21 [Candidatus Yanofskybacteria bacterium]|nr:50S ribosomal protein L21 [Candidatus Yanofskybacteria bacterium]
MADTAVIKTGGKQYLVEPGKKIKIEKLPMEEGEEVSFDEVLLRQKGDQVVIGTPLVAGAKVTGKVLQQAKGKKLIIFKFKAKKREKTKKGHRQPFTEVEILGIE